MAELSGTCCQVGPLQVYVCVNCRQLCALVWKAITKHAFFGGDVFSEIFTPRTDHDLDHLVPHPPAVVVRLVVCKISRAQIQPRKHALP